MSTPRTFIGLYLLFLASVTSLDLSHTQRLRRDSQDGVIKDDNSKAKNTLVKLSKDDFGGKLKDVLEGHKRHNDKDDNIQAFHLLFEELDELADQLPDDLYDFDITRYISQTSPGPKQAALHDLCLKNSTRLRIFLSQVHETISSVLGSVNDDLHKTSRDKDELTTDNDYTATIQPTVTDDDSKEDDSTVTRALVSSQPSDDNSRDRDSFDTEDVFEKLSEDSMECLSAFFDDDDEKFLCRQFSHQSTRVFSTLIQAGAQCTTLLDDDDDDDDDDDLDDGHQRVLLHQFMKTTPPSNWTSQDLRRALVFTSDVLDDDFLKDLSDDLFDDNLSLLGKVATRHRANPALQLAFRQRVLAVRQLDQLDSSAITSLGRGLLALSEDDFDDLNPLAILNANLKDLFDDINDHTHDDDDDDDDDRVRLALGHRMRQANVTGKDVGKLARFLYDDLVFMESVDADDLFENVKELDDLDLDDDQAAFLFRRVSQAPSFPSLSQFTRTQIQHLKPVLPGMGLSMLQQLPVAVVKESLDVFKDIDFGESQARELLDEILDFEPQEMTSKYFRSIGHLARGLDTDDIDDLDDDVISEVLDDIDDIDFNDAQKRLFADKARHLRNQPGVLALLKLPGFSHAVSIDDIDDLDDDEIVSTLNISTKIDWRPTQASAPTSEMQKILSVLAFLTCYPPYSQGVKSSCMAPPVKFGDNATLSCHFEEDMSKLQHDVLIYLYKEGTEQPVVIYAWHEGHAKIHTMAGYRCEGNISDYLVVKIVNVTESNAGQYSCLVALSKDESTTCTLRITGLPPHTSVVAVGKVTNKLLERMTSVIMTESPGISTQQMFVEHQASDTINLRFAAIVLGTLCGVLVAIFLAILIIAISHRWIPTCCSTHNNHDTLINNVPKNGNLKHIYKSTPIYKLNTKTEEDLKRVLVEPV